MMEVDAVVVGGGLAGSAAAISLTRALPGSRVLLLEQRRYPADKVCGECLSPECEPIFRRLGVWEAIESLGPAEYHAVRITSPSQAAWQAPLPGRALGLSRLRLDDLLFRQAARGAEAWDDARVAEIAGDLQEGFQVEALRCGVREKVRARVVIGAHGKRSSVDRVLHRRFLNRPQPFLALKAHFDGPAAEGRVELHGFRGGYCGINRVEAGAVNACLLVHERSFRAAGGTPARLVDWMRRANPRLDEFFSQARPLHPWLVIAGVPFEPKPPIEAGVLMAGDAAGMVCPLTGNGQAMAMRSGEMAAGFAARFLAGRAHSLACELPLAYDRAWRRRFGSRLRLARALQSVMLHPAGLTLGLRLLNALPGVGLSLIRNTRIDDF